MIGGNGYTSDYPVARLLRDAQVLTVWEGPANIQALELLRMLAPRYQGWEPYRDTGARCARPASSWSQQFARSSGVKDYKATRKR